jgi:N6-L-threonylcarbamoyladenine synthase
VNILGVETSCDETSAAVVCDGARILSNIVSSQIDIHRPYGGVVPELASRNHLQLIDAVIRDALAAAPLTFADIDAVAATYGPGLASSLLIGLNAAKGIALTLEKPFIGINHVEAHLYSPWLLSNGGMSVPPADVLPMISLVVSGGHTILAHVTGVGQHRILGQTIDDAAGEAFDKVAKLLGLGYPGGPEIDRLAKRGNRDAIKFPRSMLDDPSYNFSFSGLKTSVLYYLRKNPVGARPAASPRGEHAVPLHASVSLEDVCASFQEAVVDVLVGKAVRAAVEHGARAVSASGGVSINSRFREKLRAACAEHGLRPLLTDSSLCTDNAAMIAALAYYKLRDGQTSDFSLEAAPSIGLGV